MGLLAWNLHAIDAMLSTELRLLDGVEVHESLLQYPQDNRAHWLISTQVVEEVVAGVGPEGLCPRDVLVAVDGGRITVPRPDAFDAWIAKLRKRPRPLVLTSA